MRYITAAALSILLVSPALAEDPAPTIPASVRNASICMAYVAVSNGIDGKKEVDEQTTAAIQDLGRTLMEEGVKAKLTPPQIQDGLVKDLEQLNLAVKQSGLAEATKGVKPGCEALLVKIRAAAQQTSSTPAK